MRHLTTLLAALALAVAAPALAGKGGNGNGNGNGNGGGNDAASSASCAVDGTVVTGTGLPNWTLMNFMVTDASGTSGWVIGYTDDGTRSIHVADRTGPTTYSFAGETYGRNGSKYDVYASCQAN